jgi:hypothetical protein
MRYVTLHNNTKNTGIMNPFKTFDRLCREHIKLDKKRMQAIKRWNVSLLDEIEAQIAENLRQSNIAIEQMKAM